jgi:hypothetical protein
MSRTKRSKPMSLPDNISRQFKAGNLKEGCPQCSWGRGGHAEWCVAESVAKVKEAAASCGMTPQQWADALNKLTPAMLERAYQRAWWGADVAADFRAAEADAKGAIDEDFSA